MSTTRLREPVNDREPTLLPLSLRGKLLVFSTTLVVLPGLLYGLLAYDSGRSSLQSVIGRHLAREAGQTAERLAGVVDAELQALRSLARQDVMREIRVDDIDKRISSALAVLRGGNPIRLDYLVADRQGRVIASSDPSSIGRPAPWTGAVRAALAGAERLDGPAIPPGRAGRAGLRIAIATPVGDPDGSRAVIGALVGVYDWEGVTQVSRDVQQDLAQMGLQTNVIVIGRDGQVIGGTVPGSGLAAPDSPDWAALAGDEERGDYVTGDGLLVGRAAVDSELADWRLLIAEPIDAALVPVRRLTVRLAVALGLVLTVALVLATLGAGRVVRPLTELTRAIRNLSRGEASSFRAPVRSEDEVGTLAAAFNQMASELDQAQRDVVEAAKFAFVGELAGGVAHQVRTSLGVLRSSAQMLERALAEGNRENANELAQLVRAEVDRLGRVVDDLLNLARPRALHLEETRIAEPVFRAVDFAEPQAQEKGIRIVRVPSRGDLVALADDELLYQVTLNLLVNAIQALDDGGRIQIRTHRTEQGAVAFEVSDDGPGIPEDLREKIFGPFVTSRDDGVGLGLTFVKRVVYEHGGRIVLETEVGAGACFRVELPPAGSNP